MAILLPQAPEVLYMPPHLAECAQFNLTLGQYGKDVSALKATLVIYSSPTCVAAWGRAALMRSEIFRTSPVRQITKEEPISMSSTLRWLRTFSPKT
jgi:hypothetical protein